MMVAVICKLFLYGNMLIGGLDWDRRLRAGISFTLEYSIPHNMAFKDIELASESNWEMFVEKMKDTAKAGGKLTRRENVISITSHSLTKSISYGLTKQFKCRKQVPTMTLTHPERRKRKG